MHIHWMNDSKPLEILDIFGELWMGIWRKWVKIGAAHTESKCNFEKMWVNMDIGMDIFADTEDGRFLSVRHAVCLSLRNEVGMCRIVMRMMWVILLCLIVAYSLFTATQNLRWVELGESSELGRGLL